MGHAREVGTHEESLQDHDMLFSLSSQDGVGVFTPTLSHDLMEHIELSMAEVLCEDCTEEEGVSNFVTGEDAVSAPGFIEQSYESNIAVNTVEEESQVGSSLLQEPDVGRRRLQRMSSEEAKAERKKQLANFKLWMWVMLER